MKTGIVYGSTTGNTETVARQIGGLMAGSTVHEVETVATADYENYDLLLLGTSTWGLGDLQDDWSASLQNLSEANLKGKKVALFGLGDQALFADTFVDGIRPIHDAAEAAGATIIGKWSTAGYDHAASAAVEGDQFLGLALDFENQSHLTAGRIEAWIRQVSEEAEGHL